MSMRRLITIIITVLMLCVPAAATPEDGAPAARIKDVRTQIGDAVVAYPQLEGMTDADMQRAINDDIVASADITSHIVTLATLGDSPWGLSVDYEAYLCGDVFSAVISAKGKQPDGRNGQRYAALNYDLRTGERIEPGDIFTDADAAAAYIEEALMQSLSEELSSYLESCELAPLPLTSFTLDADGVTFWYPYKQFAYLSEYGGSCELGYCELRDLLTDEPDGVPARAGAFAKALTPAETKEAIIATVSEGRLPHIPVALGEAMSDVIDRYRLLRTPDDFPGGRYYRLEAPKFREVYVISDNIRGSGEWQHSVVEGLRTERGELCGLVIGSAVREDWRKALGEPQEVVEYTQSMAYDFALPAGQSDVYVIDGRTLSLHADEDGVLRCVRLQK